MSAKKAHEAIVNKKAYFDYEVLHEFEAGIVLEGSEVKSIRIGNVNLKGNFVHFWKNSFHIENMHISPYKYAAQEVINPLRQRRLLLNKKEIDKILAEIKQKGISAVVLEIYFKKRLVKAKIGVVRGKKLFDKRETLKKKEEQRSTERALKSFLK
ncbi:MAG: SsrA-binding protein SmpB [Candidatus Gracilibacteria bacterium]